MLPKKKRLNKAVFEQRPVARERFPYGSVAFFDHAPGVAVVVSKKTARSAVDRNRIKRRVLHALRSLSSGLTRAVVVYPTREVLIVPFGEIKKTLEVVLRTR